MCDMLDGMEEGAALRPKVMPVRSSRISSPTLELTHSSSLGQDLLKRVTRASERPSPQFYIEALDFLSNSCSGSSQVLQADNTHRDSLLSNQMEGSFWITPSGSVKRSYSHCLQEQGTYQRVVDLSEFPPCLRPCPLKEELNDEFAEKYSFVARRLTLSKILSLRDNLTQTLAVKRNIDPMIIAIAWVHFERLLSKGVLTKGNRKAYSAACVLLTFKLYGEMQLSTANLQIRELLEGLCDLDASGRLSARGIREAEFEVYVQLGFNLVLTWEDVKATHEAILKRLDRLKEA
jgi:hypothetical protein